MEKIPSTRTMGLFKKMSSRGSGVASRLILGTMLMCLTLPLMSTGGLARADDSQAAVQSQVSDGNINIASSKLGTSQDSRFTDPPSGTESWLVFDHFPNEFHSWCDAEKAPPDDGAGNTLGVAGAEDDLMCWAAAASNVLEWTGWGRVVASGRNIIDSDEMFQYFIAHWTDDTGWPYGAWQWWFDGTVNSDMHSSVDESGGGNFFNTAVAPYMSIVSLDDDPDADTMEAAGLYLYYGCGVTLSIYQEGTDAGHAITLWGYTYDPNVDPNANPAGYYKGIWVTDSDDSKSEDPPAPNRLVYYDLVYDGWYHLVDYGFTTDWYIRRVAGLQLRPNTPPLPNSGGPYSGVEGSLMNFTGSASDPDGNPLCYRWDFDSNGDWDTAWSFSTEASHVYPDNRTYYAKLAVSDYMSVVYSVATVTVENANPTITFPFGPFEVDEGLSVNVTASAGDPGTDDLTFRWEISGEVWTEEFPYYLYSGSGTSSFPYTPGDNGIYTVNLTIADEDGGENHYSTTLFVDDTKPIITPFGDSTVDEGSNVTLNADVWDFGSDDLEFTWNFDLAPTIINMYYNNGLSPDPPDSPGGMFPFHAEDGIVQPYGDDGFYTYILTVKDDEGVYATRMPSITVRNVAPNLSSCSMNQPEPHFILPIVHNLTFSAVATDPGSDDLYFFWDWGDGTPDTENPHYFNGISPDPDRSPEKNSMTAAEWAHHAYAAPGNYTVTLIVSDDDGGIATTTMAIHVADAAEASSIIGQYIQSLPNTAFKSDAAKQKAAFDGLFQAVGKTLAAEQYKASITILKNIRSKTDGYMGGSKTGDWIVQEAPQRVICHMINDLIAYLTYLV